MAGTEESQLTEADKTEVFRIATRRLASVCDEKFPTGMTDAELKQALKLVLGQFGDAEVQVRCVLGNRAQAERAVDVEADLAGQESV